MEQVIMSRIRFLPGPGALFPLATQQKGDQRAEDPTKTKVGFYLPQHEAFFAFEEADAETPRSRKEVHEDHIPQR